MKEVWSYNLPYSDSNTYADYETPFIEHNGELLFVSSNRSEISLIVLDSATGEGKEHSLNNSVPIFPKLAFLDGFYGGVIVYTGDLFCYSNGAVTKIMELRQKGKVQSHIIFDRFLYIVSVNDYRESELICINLDSFQIEWSQDVSSNPYISGPVDCFERKIVCFGRESLLLFDPASGSVIDSLKIPRIGKLFCAVRLDDEHIALGYTNWSSAGIIKYNLITNKVIWKNGRRFEGPLLRCKIFKKDNRLYWVKNDTELIGLNEDDGEEVFAVKTYPWLYTDLFFKNDKIIFGTAGNGGSINCIQDDNGAEKWRIPTDYGVCYFGDYENSVIVSNIPKSEIIQIDIDSGNVIQTYDLCGEAIGRIKVFGHAFYTVVLNGKSNAASLVKFDLR